MSEEKKEGGAHGKSASIGNINGSRSRRALSLHQVGAAIRRGKVLDLILPALACVREKKRLSDSSDPFDHEGTMIVAKHDTNEVNLLLVESKLIANAR